LLGTGAFIAKYWLRMVWVSAVVLIPCFWHRHIAASDLGSHLYNAWLAQLIRHGQAPGLYLSGQLTNVLFDWMLSGLAIFGFAAAEKVAVSICVLIFFWGAFALVAACTGRPPWFLTPLIALFAYGWTFHIGLYNYYLAIGISFFCLALFIHGTWPERALIIPCLVVVAMAHPFGVLWLVAACAYVACSQALSWRYQIALLAFTAALIFGIHYVLWHHFVIEPEPHRWYYFNGFDQLMLFGQRYWYIAGVLGGLAAIALTFDLITRRKEAGVWRGYWLAVQIYVVVELASVLFPRTVTLPGKVPISLIPERLTSIAAIGICCVLGAMRPRRCHLIGLLIVAGIFGAFLYQDTGVVNDTEAQAERLVHTLPPNQRVVASIFELNDRSRIMIQHNIDLACIGWCFDYGNYEPSSAVFRVRATPGNPYVITDYETAIDTEDGTYEVQPQDLPMYQVYQCTETGRVLCIRALSAGEQNNGTGAYEQP
jgi:hypothetical protein